jgi:lauroyl/myristoyl acyltransferase
VIIQNADYGISAEVTQMADGRWRVMLRDDDTGQTVGPSVRLFTLEADALAFAEKLCS